MSFGAARAGFVRLPRSGLLLAASEDAYGQGIKGLPGAWPPGPVPGLARVRFRELAGGEDSAGLALRWDAPAPGGGLLSALDANLTLTKAGEQASLLALAGIYRLPATALTAAPSTVIIDLAAAATIRTFLTRVADGIGCPPANVAQQHRHNPLRRRMSVSTVPRCGARRDRCASGEDMVTDLVDGVIQALQSGHDALPGQVMRQVNSGLQAHANLEPARRHLVE